MKIPASLYKYLTSGVITVIVEYCLFIALLAVNTQLLIANAISFCVALCVSFTLNRQWSFKSARYKTEGHKQFAGYFVLALCNLAVSSAIVGLLVHSGLVPLIAKAFSIGTIASYNFFLYKHAIFNHKSHTERHG